VGPGTARTRGATGPKMHDVGKEAFEIVTVILK